MLKRHSENTNLKLTYGSDFKGLKIQSQHGPLVKQYLESTLNVINAALSRHPRLFAVRVDLRYPRHYTGPVCSKTLRRFMDSLGAQLEADYNKKRRRSRWSHKSDLFYVWAKEQSDYCDRPHYHVLLMFNRDAYHCLGDYEALEGNMAARIKRAWASPLRMDTQVIGGALYFPDNCQYSVDANSPSFSADYQRLFYRVSYLAKAKTKGYGDRTRSFGCSAPII